MIDSSWVNRAFTPTGPSDWKPATGYRFHILITKDEDGTYSAVALNLPGIGSCGDTEDEALENAKEAIRGALESYVASNEEIPWKDTSSEKIPFGAEQKWIIVNGKTS